MHERERTQQVDSQRRCGYQQDRQAQDGQEPKRKQQSHHIAEVVLSQKGLGSQAGMGEQREDDTEGVISEIFVIAHERRAFP